MTTIRDSFKLDNKTAFVTGSGSYISSHDLVIDGGFYLLVSNGGSMGGEDTCYLAVDLGAESGRVVAGLYGEDRLRLEEVHRFPNVARRDSGHLRWDIEGLFEGVCAGLKKAGNRYGAKIHSLGVDAWGVDYGLVDEAGALLGAPVAYRDERTTGVMERVFQIVSKKRYLCGYRDPVSPFQHPFSVNGRKRVSQIGTGASGQIAFHPRPDQFLALRYDGQ